MLLIWFRIERRRRNSKLKCESAAERFPFSYKNSAGGEKNIPNNTWILYAAGHGNATEK